MPIQKHAITASKVSDKEALELFQKIRASVKNHMTEDEVNDLVHEVRHERARRARH